VAIRKKTSPGIIGVRYPMMPTPTKIKPIISQKVLVMAVVNGDIATII
jgi:hypothetical protein